MATSSITKDFIIDNDETCKSFIKAYKESRKKVLAKNIDYSKDNSFEEGVEKFKLYCSKFKKS